MSVFARKTLANLLQEAHDSGEHSLKRTLGPIQLTALGVGGVIGAGIFVLSGLGAHYAGPGLMLSFVISGLGCAFAALCYAEFAAMIPLAGSAYTYAYATLGEIFAWIIGWDLILEYAFGAATVAVGWSGYVVSLFRDTLGINFPLALSKGPFDPPIPVGDGTFVHGVVNLPGLLIAIAVTLLLIRGIKESASFNSIIVIVKVLVVVLFIVEIGRAHV